MSTPLAAPRRPIAISMGDAAGIGPEIIVQAFLAQPALLQDCLVVGDVGCMRRAAALFQTPGVPRLAVAELQDFAQWRADGPPRVCGAPRCPRLSGLAPPAPAPWPAGVAAASL